MTRFWVNVEAVVWRDNTFLTIERGREETYGAGWLAFPGGKVDWIGESPNTLETTASRELLEEVGLDIDGPWHFVESKSFGIDAEPVLDVVLLAHSATGEPFNNAPGEVASFSWMSAEDIRNDPRTQPWTLATLHRLQETLVRLGW